MTSPNSAHVVLVGEGENGKEVLADAAAESWRYKVTGDHRFVHVYPNPFDVPAESVRFRGIRVSPRGICRNCGMVRWVVARRPTDNGKNKRSLWRRGEDVILPWGQVPQFNGNGLLRPPVWNCDRPIPEELIQPLQAVIELTEQAILQERIAELAMRIEEKLNDQIAKATADLLAPLLTLRDKTIRSATQKAAANKRKKTQSEG